MDKISLHAPYKQTQPSTQGNSGGPLINIQGQVIGITSSKISNNGQTSVEGMGFYIPANDVVNIIKQLEEKGKVDSTSSWNPNDGFIQPFNF